MIRENAGAATLAAEVRSPAARRAPRSPRAAATRPARTRRTTPRTGTRVLVRRLAGGAGLARRPCSPAICGLDAGAARRPPPSSIARIAAAVVAARPPGASRRAGASWRLPSASTVAATRRGGRATPPLAIVDVHVEHLHRGDGDAVADRHRRHARVVVVRRAAGAMPGASPGKPSPVALAEPERCAARRRSAPGPSMPRDHDRADVRRLAQDVGDASSSTGASRRPRTLCRRRSSCRGTVEHGVGLHEPGLERGRDRDHLVGRPGSNTSVDGPVRARSPARAAPGASVGRAVDGRHREHVAGAHVGDDRHAALAPRRRRPPR